MDINRFIYLRFQSQIVCSLILVFYITSDNRIINFSGFTHRSHFLFSYRSTIVVPSSRYCLKFSLFQQLSTKFLLSCFPRRPFSHVVSSSFFSLFPIFTVLSKVPLWVLRSTPIYLPYQFLLKFPFKTNLSKLSMVVYK